MTHKLMRVPYLLFSLFFLFRFSHPPLLPPYNPLVAILGRLAPFLSPSGDCRRCACLGTRKIQVFFSLSSFIHQQNDGGGDRCFLLCNGLQKNEPWRESSKWWHTQERRFGGRIRQRRRWVMAARSLISRRGCLKSEISSLLCSALLFFCSFPVCLHDARDDGIRFEKNPDQRVLEKCFSLRNLVLLPFYKRSKRS